MAVILTQEGTFGPFDRVEELEDRVRCYRGAEVVDLLYATIGDYTISDDASLAPVPLLPAPSREELKAARQAAVEAIKVTTAAGNTFDGDETSQTRMARAIIALQATGTPAVTWVLADNSVIQATAAELAEALALAGAAQAALWVIA